MTETERVAREIWDAWGRRIPFDDLGQHSHAELHKMAVREIEIRDATAAAERAQLPGIDVAFTYYPPDRPEVTQWHKLPAVPAPGDTVHLPVTADDGEPDSLAFRVSHVSWANDQPMGWHAEISLTNR